MDDSQDYGLTSDFIAVSSSTIVGNCAGYGGGIYWSQGDGWDLAEQSGLTNVTIANNRATLSGGGIFVYYGGNSGHSLALNNTIVADNLNVSSPSTPADDISISNDYVDLSSSNNLIGPGGSGGLQDQSVDPAHHNLVGVGDPGLASLADNGGPTQTVLPLVGSPAIDAGDPFAIGGPTDQRGYARVVGLGMDIGAVESGAVAADSGLSVTGLASPSGTSPLSQEIYTLTVSNYGPNTQAAVTLADTLPAGTTLVSWQPTSASASGWSLGAPASGSVGTVTAWTGSLASGASATFTLVVQVATGSDFSNTASVGPVTGDPAPSNESVTLQTRATRLAVSSTAANGTAQFGENVTFTAKVSTVASGTTTPSGTVQFQIDGQNFGNPQPLNANATAFLTTSALAVGAHRITAVYSGDTEFFASFAEVPRIITTIAGNDTQGYSGDGGPATAAQLWSPEGVAFNAAGDLFFADTGNNVIREVSPTGVITTVAGNGTLGYSGNGGPATAAQLNRPTGVAVDASGDLFIVDYGNQVIREVSPVGVITTVAGNGTLGYSGDGGPATAAQLWFPEGVTVNAAGDLFIADTGNYVIREVSPTGVITTVAGNGTRGYSGDGGLATAAQLNRTTGVAIDAAGDIIIADSYNSVIREVSPAGVITTVAGAYHRYGYSGDGGPATAARLAVPNRVAVDAAGDLFIADTAENVLREVSLAGVITTVAQFQSLAGVAFDAAGNLFISESGPVNNVIFKVSPSLFVNQAGTTTTVTSSSSTSISGQVITFTATVGVVAPGAGIPTGTVTFLDGSTTLGTGTLDNSGLATFTTAGLSVGTHTITATCNSLDTNFTGSTSVALTQQVNAVTAANLVQALTSAPGNAVTMQANATSDVNTVLSAVSNVDPSTAGTLYLNLSGFTKYGSETVSAPANVTVYINGLQPPQVPTTVDPTVPALIVKSGKVVVSYVTFTESGDAPTILVTGGSLTLRNDIIQESTCFTDAAISVSGGRLDLGSTASPGGNIINVNGTGSLVLNTGPNPVTTVGNTYEVSGNVLTSASTIAYLLNPTTLTSVTTSATPAVPGQPVTFKAMVAPQVGSGSPGGSIDFFDTTTAIDLGSLSLSSGSATLSTSTLVLGSHIIKATYSGDGSFLASSGTLTQIITQSIYVLNKTESGALTVSGHASINIPGNLIVDSSSRTALTESGNATVKAASIRVVGGVSTSGNATISPAAATGVAAVADPLAGLAVPSGGVSQTAVNFSGNSTLTINPGIYSSISVAGNARLKLNPGIYTLAGGGLTVTGNASISGSGILLYNTANSSGTYGGITLSGNGTVNVTAAASGTYAGVVLFQARANTRAINLSGSAVEGLGGTIYAPAALLYLSGNASLAGPVVVNQLSLTGNAASTQAADASDVSGGDAAGQLLAGNLVVYVNDPAGQFTADELARIQDAVNAVDAVVEPFGVAVTETTDSSLANVVVDTGNTTPVGGYADGILGCWSPAGEITMVQGWNWYASSDPTQIGASQYDFQTTMTHELGHALGLGESSTPTSAMSGTLAAGTVIRALTTADLNIPDAETGVDAQRAAPLDTHVALVSLPDTNSAPLEARSPEAQAAILLTMVQHAAPDSLAGSLPANISVEAVDTRAEMRVSVPWMGESPRAAIHVGGKSSPLNPGVVSTPLPVSLQASDQLFAEWSGHLPGTLPPGGAEGRLSAAAWQPAYPRLALPLGRSERLLVPETASSERDRACVTTSGEHSLPDGWQAGVREWSLAAFLVAAALAGPREVLADKVRDRVFAGLANTRDADDEGGRPES